MANANQRTIIRMLEPGDPIPNGTPARYFRHGYVVLRWKIARRLYVELFEHRALTGNAALTHVHHKNCVKHDNRPENLEVVTAGEHRARHMRLNDGAIAEAYKSGATTLQIAARFGCNAGSVSRSLARSGVKTRPLGQQRRRPIDYKAVEALHVAGHRTMSIARALGSTAMVVRRALRDIGLQPHSVGCPPKHLVIREHQHRIDITGNGDGQLVVTRRSA